MSARVCVCVGGGGGGGGGGRCTMSIEIEDIFFDLISFNNIRVTFHGPLT